ncbi:Imm6 family immunity protein [Ruminococcus sp.]|uniref:Imm6 family immunity protein n=1 Tax=Ruminococcus sp. TaxID=41978 RepID=UPI0025DE946D|nr:Imm6 family immunity protein [Ruminococcus sp.]MBQ8967584.1 hypothetical protein [Ruminococcus sp.]
MTSKALSYLSRLAEEHRSVSDKVQAELLDRLFNEFEDHEKTADELYELLGAEGLFNETDVFDNAVLAVLSCVVCKAYIDEGQKYLPEDIESIQADKLDGFFAYLAKFPSAEECYGYFRREVCL